MSLINHKCRAAFVHVPKTAGRSVKEHFGGIGSGHTIARDLLRPSQDVFAFGFVRNPYDRLVAVYHGAVQHGGIWPKLRRETFAAFVRRLPDDWQIEPHAWPMTTFLCDEDGRILVDFVGRFERLEEDWDNVCQRIHLRRLPLPRRHASERNHWRAYYTPELAGIVDEVYREDFRTFAYPMLTQVPAASRPYMTCLCPTYKRPRLLQNSLACFLQQKYPPDRCQLLISDDAGQFDSQAGPNWRVVSSAKRFNSLPDKFNALMSEAFSNTDIFVVWEDDEIFSPGHLESIANAWEWSGKASRTFFAPRKVWSTCGEPKGQVHLENASGRFHSSWAYTRELAHAVGGYPRTEALIFDQQMGAHLRRSAAAVAHYEDSTNPTFVYRWGNGIYHGSQRGDAGYAALWKELEMRPAPRIGTLVPEFDDETQAVLNHLAGL